METANDPVIWERAQSDGTVIISKDEDFIDRWLLSADPVRLVWVRRGNCSNRALLALPAGRDVLNRDQAVIVGDGLPGEIVSG